MSQKFQCKICGQFEDVEERFIKEIEAIGWYVCNACMDKDDNAVEFFHKHGFLKEMN